MARKPSGEGGMSALRKHRAEKLRNAPRDETPKVNILWSRCGGALGLAYAMYDRGERMRDVKHQLREARSLAAAERHALE